VIGNAVHVMRIATGEIDDNADPAKEHHRRGGKIGGAARRDNNPASAGFSLIPLAPVPQFGYGRDGPTKRQPSE
jgi:hypothetical protein